MESLQKEESSSELKIGTKFLNKFKEHFPNSGKVFLAVVHCQNEEQTLRNVLKAQKAGAHGVFLINHGTHYGRFSPELLLKFADTVVKKVPDYWIGLNLLRWTSLTAFEKLPQVFTSISEYGWTMQAFELVVLQSNSLPAIDERLPAAQQSYAQRVCKAQEKVGFNGLYFGGVAFKYQREVKELEKAAIAAAPWMDVITTSGPGTGQAADPKKLERIRSVIGVHPLAIASGITADNVEQFTPYADAFLVATGVSSSFHELDEEKMKKLAEILKDKSH